MRLFVAIELDDSIHSTAVRLIEELRPHAPGLKWLRPESLHLTLKFIGHVEEQQLEPLKKALSLVRASSAAELVFTRLWWMPNPRRPTVFWTGVKEDDVLADVAKQIDRSLEPLGIAPESRPFRPHLTLARYPRKRLPDAQRLQEAVANLNTANFGRMETREFILFESQLSPGGAKYTKLERFEFVRAL